MEVTHWLLLHYVIQSDKHIKFLCLFFSPHSNHRQTKKKKQDSNDTGFKIIAKLCAYG